MDRGFIVETYLRKKMYKMYHRKSRSVFLVFQFPSEEIYREVFVAAVQFCNGLGETVWSQWTVNLLYRLDYFCGLASTQNDKYLWPDNSPVTHKVHLHNIKVGVWCAVSASRRVRTIFFSDTVNAEGYSGHILAPFFKNISVRENEYMFFQQGSLNCLYSQWFNGHFT